MTTTRVQVANNVAHVLFGGTHLNVHQRFQQDRVSALSAFLEDHRTSDLERHFRGVDIVVGAVDQGCFHADHRVTSQNAKLHSVLNTSVDRRNVLARHATTGHLILKLVQFLAIQRQRLEGNLHLRELTGTTGLLLVGVVDLLNGLLNGLAVCNLRLTNVSLNLELTLHTVNNDVQVELAHTTDFGLAGLFVQRHGEGGVLSRKLLDSGRHLLLVTLGLRLNSHEDHGGGEGHRLKHNRVCRIAQGITSSGVLQTNRSIDVACSDFLNRVLLVGLHLEELAEAFLLTLSRVKNLLTLGRVTGVHTGVDELTVERVSCNLVGQSRKRLIRRCLTGKLLFLIRRARTLNVGNIQRGRQVVDHSIQHGLNAAVLECGTAEHRECLAVDGQLANTSLELINREFFTFEVLLHEFLAGLGNSLDQLCAVLFSLSLQVSGDLPSLVLCPHGHVALRVAGPYVCLHFEQVNHADKVALSADRQLHNERFCAQAINNSLNGEVEVRTHLIHLVDEADAGNVVLISLTPHGLRLRLNTFLTVKYRYRAVKHAQRTLHLNGEVNVAGGVDNIDLVVFPEAGDSCGGNGNTALLLLSHPVHS